MSNPQASEDERRKERASAAGGFKENADLSWEHSFATAQGSAYHRFPRALDRRNVTEALSAAAELQFVGLTEALELTLLLTDGEPAKYERAALRWHLRFVYESKHTPGGIARRTPTLGLPIRRGRRCSPR